LLFFNEIQTIEALYETPVVVKGSNLERWQERVAATPEMQNLKKLLDMQIKRFKSGL
jgi:hypothetical protein